MAMAFARMARQRHVVGPALLAASTIAFVPRATVCRGTPDRFFASQQGGSEEDDVARLKTLQTPEEIYAVVSEATGS